MAGTEERYPLGAPETPENDASDERPDVVEAFTERVAQREANITETALEREELSEEVRTRLHELGYVGE